MTIGDLAGVVSKDNRPVKQKPVVVSFYFLVGHFAIIEERKIYFFLMKLLLHFIFSVVLVSYSFQCCEEWKRSAGLIKLILRKLSGE